MLPGTRGEVQQHDGGTLRRVGSSVFCVGHGVEGSGEPGDGDGCGGTEGFRAGFAEEDDGEIGGADVEAAADGDLLVGVDEGRTQVAQDSRGAGGIGLLKERDQDEIAARQVDFVVVEGVELLAEASIEGGGCEDEEYAVAADEGGEGLLGEGSDGRRQECEGEEDFAHLGFSPGRRCVLLKAEFIGGRECAGKGGFVGDGEADVGGAVASPAAFDGEEDVGGVGEEEGLLFRGEHEVAEAFFDGGEGGEDAAADAEVGCAHVGGFFGAGEGEGDAAEVGWGHGLRW